MFTAGLYLGEIGAATRLERDLIDLAGGLLGRWWWVFASVCVCDALMPFSCCVARGRSVFRRIPEEGESEKVTGRVARWYYFITVVAWAYVVPESGEAVAHGSKLSGRGLRVLKATLAYLVASWAPAHGRRYPRFSSRRPDE